MKHTGTLLSLLGASCLVAFSTATPAQADTKPCCYNNGDYYEASPKTCRNYGGRVVEQGYCRADYYGQRPRGSRDTSFSIQLGDIVFAYSDGYYDRNRTWHRWSNNRQRDWYRQNRRTNYYETTRNRDRDRNRRDWRDGRRDDWR